MHEFEPGDRVIICDGSDLQGRIAVVSDDSVKVFKPSKGIVYVKLGPFHLPFSDHDLRPAWQTCKDCDGDGGIHKWGGLFVCRTCDGDGYKYRAGPYRLADGTWSDGVDRTRVIPSHEFSKANPDRVYVHGTWDQDDLGRWKPYFDVWRGDTCIKTGWPFAEAIAYADNLARTTKSGDAS